MATIGKLWAGRIFGTNTGNVFVELTSSENDLKGKARILDDRWGLTVYEIHGTFDGTKVLLEGESSQAPEGVNAGSVKIEGALTPEGTLKGQWSSTLGTGGTFILNPHEGGFEASSTNKNDLLPERVHVAVRNLGALRLYADDVRELINFLRKDFALDRRVIVTYIERGNEISKYSTDFENDFNHIGNLKYLKLTVQEIEAYGIARSATVTLNADLINEVRIQGVQESWVIGKAEALHAFLKLRQKTLATTFRKFGLNVNILLAIFGAAAIPELSFYRRMLFGAFLVFIWWAVLQVHTRYIPNVVISLSTLPPTRFEKTWPQIVSWTSAVASAVAASTAYGLLKGELSIPSWIQKLIG